MKPPLRPAPASSAAHRSCAGTDLKTTPEGFIRWIYPQHSRCPACGDRHWTPAGHHDARRYRRCDHCLITYPVSAIGIELDQGGRTSVIKPL